MSTPEAWKLSIPCDVEMLAALETRIAALNDADGQPPTIVTSEITPTRWQLDAYFTCAPELPADLAGHGLEAIWPDDWVTMSQEALKPIRAGRFHVYSSATAASLPPSKIGLRIEAGPAFGTGQHATTTGCLLALDRLAKRHRCARALDLGTGTGILALAIARRFRATVIASDIDAPSIAFARDIIRANRQLQGCGGWPGQIETVAAAGLAHVRLRTRAPYDLVVANILAAPLIALAPALARVLMPGGVIILAGLLDTQERAVRQTYLTHGMVLESRQQIGEWPTLVLRKR